MPPSADVIRADFDRIATHARAAAEAIEPAARRLVAEVPLRSRVLEIGCGTGLFARELATRRGARITAIDLAPRMIDVARVRTGASLGIDYRVADFMELSPRGFDVVVAINTLHHLPLAVAAERMASAVVPGGLVLIADLFEARGARELPYNALSWLLRQPHAHAPDLATAWQEHGTHDELMPLHEVRATLRRAMPGVSVRRHLGWRYTAVWRSPSRCAAAR
ncbi:MAG TPA: class I SAM-dependent methyltransferase [Kofleriaceae bacterium]|nr:class I SAM-dependent methyltransferase [Kofleriaceae bacterium]